MSKFYYFSSKNAGGFQMDFNLIFVCHWQHDVTHNQYNKNDKIAFSTFSLMVVDKSVGN